MKICITANPEIKSALKATRNVLEILKGKHEVVIENEAAKVLGLQGTALEKIKADLILAIGGDGTVLRAFQKTDEKVLGINTGSLGFLAEGEWKSLNTIMSRLLKGDYRIENRLKIKVTVNGKRLYDCVNEAVVHTSQVSKMRSFEIKIDGAIAEQVKADGIIVATPTGSTSYAMSAGGPILDPRVDAFVIAAIAPFKPSFHPFIVPASSEVQVGFVRPKTGLLVLDGQQEIPMRGKEKVILSKSEKPARLIRLGDNFYKRIKEKLANP